MNADDHQGQEPQRCLKAVQWPADPLVWLLGLTEDHESAVIEPPGTGSLRSAQDWAAVVDAYQRAGELAGLVTGLLIEAGFTIGPDGEVRAVVGAVSTAGAPRVQIHAGRAGAQRLRAWLSVEQDARNGSPVPAAVSPPPPGARPPGGDGRHRAA